MAVYVHINKGFDIWVMLSCPSLVSSPIGDWAGLVVQSDAEPFYRGFEDGCDARGTKYS